MSKLLTKSEIFLITYAGEREVTAASCVNVGKGVCVHAATTSDNVDVPGKYGAELIGAAAANHP